MKTATQKKFIFSSYQKLVIAILAFLQFTIVLDFMIMSPLGAILMPALNMSSSQFGLVVSAYAFSAGISGILAAGFADNYDRKKLLMFFYIGFIVGTFLCGIAPNYEFLLFARIITGIFGGVIGSVVLAITTDLFAFEQRGQVMGYIQTAFAASQIFGIPVSLFLANHWGWHWPFMFIVAVGAAVGFVISAKLKPVTEHLKIKSEHKPARHLLNTLKRREYYAAFWTTALMTLGGFLLMPFMSAFVVNNVGIGLEKLPLIYLVTGISAIFTGPLVGKAADKFGKFKVFLWGAIFTIITVNIYVHLGVTPLWVVILINVIMFASIFSRMIPSQALISTIPKPENRGAFNAVNSSLQQLSGGVASLVAGLIVYVTVSGRVENFEILGYILTCTTIISIFLMKKISRKVEG